MSVYGKENEAATLIEAGVACDEETCQGHFIRHSTTGTSQTFPRYYDFPDAREDDAVMDGWTDSPLRLNYTTTTTTFLLEEVSNLTSPRHTTFACQTMHAKTCKSKSSFQARVVLKI
jgi:hypothetical protein